jgi:HEAT repeat protein
MTFSKAEGITADDAISVLLPPPGTPSKEARAMSIFALQVLVEEPDLRDETVDQVIDTAIDNLNESDSWAKRNTLMDEVLYSLMRSCFAERCRKRLLRRYIKAHGEHRVRIGAAYSSVIANDEILNADNSVEILEPLLGRLNDDTSTESHVEAALELLDAFYRPQGLSSSARINFLPDSLLQKTVNVLLKTAEYRDENNAVSLSALWALGWLTSAKTCHIYNSCSFTEIELDVLRQIVTDEGRDAYSRMWSALILSVCGTEMLAFNQTDDWIMEWSYVADGRKPHKELPVITPLNRSKDIKILKSLIASDVPEKPRQYGAIVMGRLGSFIPEMIEPLLQIFQDDLWSEEQRDEALLYLVLIGGTQIIFSLTQIINGLMNEDDVMLKNSKSVYDLRSHALLALVGMGDVNALKYQLNLGEGEQIDLDAYAYALAGVENFEGQKMLENMKNHENKQVRDAITHALSQLKQWNQSKAQRSSSTPSDSDTYVDRHIARRGHLIHKLKAKDSTGRWAYYFVLIQPNLEQKFMQALESTETLDLEDYGKVVASCYGESPNETIKASLKEKYGFDV